MVVVVVVAAGGVDKRAIRSGGGGGGEGGKSKDESKDKRWRPAEEPKEQFLTLGKNPLCLATYLGKKFRTEILCRIV